MHQKTRNADLRSLRINLAGLLVSELRVCMQVTAYGAPMNRDSKQYVYYYLFPFGLSGGACMLVVLIDIVLPWRGEDIEDACRSLRDNA